MVKKILPIFLLSIYLVSVTELHEFFKLPQLVEHFMEHKSEDSKTSLLNFLMTHYANADDGDGDKSEDMQLPFKTHETECCISIATVLPTPVQVKFKHSEPVSVEYNILNDDVPVYLMPASIFQPPRV